MLPSPSISDDSHREPSITRRHMIEGQAGSASLSPGGASPFKKRRIDSSEDIVAVRHDELDEEDEDIKPSFIASNARDTPPDFGDRANGSTSSASIARWRRPGDIRHSETSPESTSQDPLANQLFPSTTPSTKPPLAPSLPNSAPSSTLSNKSSSKSKSKSLAAYQACKACKAGKKGCDERKPCMNCVKRGIPCETWNGLPWSAMPQQIKPLHRTSPASLSKSGLSLPTPVTAVFAPQAPQPQPSSSGHAPPNGHILPVSAANGHHSPASRVEAGPSVLTSTPILAAAIRQPAAQLPAASLHAAVTSNTTLPIPLRPWSDLLRKAGIKSVADLRLVPLKAIDEFVASLQTVSSPFL